MELLTATKEDVNDIDRLYQKFYSEQPPINLRHAFAHVLVNKDKESIGFGYLSLIVEASVILNLDARERDKFEALKMIIDRGKLETSEAGFDLMYVVAKDPKFSGILTKHLEFSKSKGDWLVMNLEPSNGEQR